MNRLLTIGLKCSLVLMVIGFLSILLYPSCGCESSPRGRAVSCMSNLKQDSLAMLMYVQDYDEMLPPMSQWMDRSNPYLHKNSRTLQCPEVSNASRGNASKFGYAGNSEISEKSMSTIAHPESTLLIYDSTNVAWNAHDARKTLAARHEGKVGIGFLDGHAGMPPLPMR